MYRFRPKKYTSVLTIIILITIIYYLQVVLSTFREFPGHIVELPVQVSHSGTTVQRISGLKKNVCHSPLSHIHLSFSKDRMLFRTQKPCQTGLTSPFRKFKGKVLVTSDSMLLSSEVLLFTQGWWTAQPAAEPSSLPEPSLLWLWDTMHTVPASSRQQQLSKLPPTKWRV